MALTDGVEGGDANSSQNPSTSKGHLQEIGMLKQDESHFPFLQLPAEVRNEIYEDVFDLHKDLLTGRSRLLDQPAITRVNRQTRAEALELYYDFSILEVETISSKEWVPFVQKVLDAFNGGPRGLPDGSPSTLRFLSALRLSFSTKVAEVEINVNFDEDPENIMELEPEDYHEVVVVGSPDMDWTDPAAVQAACDDAARQLADDITNRTFRILAEQDLEEEDVELVAASTLADQRAAVDALRLVALACPHLRPSICICDVSAIDENERTDDYGDEYFDPEEYVDPVEIDNDILEELVYGLMNGG